MKLHSGRLWTSTTTPAPSTRRQTFSGSVTDGTFSARPLRFETRWESVRWCTSRPANGQVMHLKLQAITIEEVLPSLISMLILFCTTQNSITIAIIYSFRSSLCRIICQEPRSVKFLRGAVGIDSGACYPISCRSTARLSKSSLAGNAKQARHARLFKVNKYNGRLGRPNHWSLGWRAQCLCLRYPHHLLTSICHSKIGNTCRRHPLHCVHLEMRTSWLRPLHPAAC